MSKYADLYKKYGLSMEGEEETPPPSFGSPESKYGSLYYKYGVLSDEEKKRWGEALSVGPPRDLMAPLPEPPRETTWGEFAQGVGAMAAEGILGASQATAMTARAIDPLTPIRDYFSGTDPEKAKQGIAEFYKPAQDALRSMQPEAFQREMANPIIGRDEKGNFTGFNAPTAEQLVGTLAQSAAYIPSMLAGGGLGSAGAKSLGLSKGLGEFIGFGGSNAASVAQNQYAETFNEVKSALLEQGRSEEEATRIAGDAASEAERNTAALSFATGGLGGALASRLGGASASRLGGAAKGFLGDALFEAPEEAGQTAISQLSGARGQLDTREIEQAAALGAIAGGGPGAVIGFFSYDPAVREASAIAKELSKEVDNSIADTLKKDIEQAKPSENAVDFPSVEEVANLPVVEEPRSVEVPPSTPDILGRLDERLAELDRLSKEGVLGRSNRLALEKEQNELRSLLSDQERMDREGIVPADAASRLSDEERLIATNRLGEIRTTLEKDRAAKGYGNELRNINDRLSKIDNDNDLVTFAQSVVQVPSTRQQVTAPVEAAPAPAPAATQPDTPAPEATPTVTPTPTIPPTEQEVAVDEEGLASPEEVADLTQTTQALEREVAQNERVSRVTRSLVDRGLADVDVYYAPPKEGETGVTQGRFNIDTGKLELNAAALDDDADVAAVAVHEINHALNQAKDQGVEISRRDLTSVVGTDRRPIVNKRIRALSQIYPEMKRAVERANKAATERNNPEIGEIELLSYALEEITKTRESGKNLGPRLKTFVRDMVAEVKGFLANQGFVDLSKSFNENDLYRLGKVMMKEYASGTRPLANAQSLANARLRPEQGSVLESRTTATDSIPVNEGKNIVKYNGVNLGYDVEGNKVNLYKVNVPRDLRGKGAARQALQAFVSEMDKAGKTVELDAIPQSADTNEADLVRLYESVGFKVTEIVNDSPRMVREPTSDNILESRKEITKKKVTKRYELTDKDRSRLKNLTVSFEAEVDGNPEVIEGNALRLIEQQQKRLDMLEKLKACVGS